MVWDNSWESLFKKRDWGKYPNEELIKEFLDNNIQVRPIWHLNHLQKPYKTCQSFKINFAQKLVKNCICLPSSFSLTKKEQSEIIKIMESKNGLG